MNSRLLVPRTLFATDDRVFAASHTKGATAARSGPVPKAEPYHAMGFAPLKAGLRASLRNGLAAERRGFVANGSSECSLKH